MTRRHVEPLGETEVRVYTLATGDSHIVRIHARYVLGGLLDCDSADVAFTYGEHGKPFVKNDAGLHFSISHTDTVSMIAVTRVAPVGVDIERIRPVPRAENILKRFAPADFESILASDNRDVQFAQIWTRMEAEVKVRGASIWDAAMRDPSVVAKSLAAPEGYAAAVAVASSQWEVSQDALELV